ncbi:MAG: type I glyceraldehyde-3-phosphate dehydrogenase [Bacilli bacterium]
MAIKVAINGFGRIGRLAFRLMEEDSNYEIVAINDLTDAETLAYLLKYDSAQKGYRQNEISFEEEQLIVGDKKIKIYAEKDANNLPWKDLAVDVVMECSGFYTDKDKAMAHINAGARKVIISAPAKGDLKTIVYNVNHNILDGSEQIISCASCTTNCLAPVLKILDDNFKVIKGFMTTVHSYTNDQNTLDSPHKKGIKARRGRAAAANIVPSSTGAAKAIGLVLPNLDSKLNGIALRVPTISGSIIDLTIEIEKSTTIEEINNMFKNNANETLGYTEDPIVSSDIIGDLHGGVFDALSTSIVEVNDKQLIKVMAWYDNEMGYTVQMIRTAKYFSELIGD